MKKRDLSHLSSAEPGRWERLGTKLALQAGTEGAVLLENNGALPLSPCRIGLYGHGARHTVVSGIGSGDIHYRSFVTVEQGLLDHGFTISSTEWLDEYDRQYADGRRQLLDQVERRSRETGIDSLHCFYDRPHILPDSQSIDAARAEADGADAAIYVLSRKEGEGCDNRYVKGEYLPSDRELEQLRTLRGAYSTLILLLNTGSPIEMEAILKIGPDAVLDIFQGGALIGTGAARLICGLECPSGRLTSTWARDYWDHPNSREFGDNDGDTRFEVYREGQLMGYRWFDTFGTEPRYPFGYGLSYTGFDIKCAGIERQGSEISVKAMVRNTGERAGKEVVQLYAAEPGRELPQPRQKLWAYAKTPRLAPGESCLVKLRVRLEDMAAFSPAKRAYLLEAGDYVLFLGSSSRKNRVCGVLRLTGERITRRVDLLFGMPVQFDETEAPERVYTASQWAEIAAAEICTVEPEDIPAEGRAVYPGPAPDYLGVAVEPGRVNLGAGEQIRLDVPGDVSLAQVKKGERSLQELIASMDEEELIQLVTGQEHIDPRYLMHSLSTHVPGAAGESTNYFLRHRPEREIPYTVLADGPAGLRLVHEIQTDENGDVVYLDPLLSYEGGEFVRGDGGYVPGRDTFYQYVTALPVSVQLASTWNSELLYEIGRVIGGEMERYDVDLWLAPGINLHRNPLCGRNFEYFSEDPVVSAVTAIALIRGVQSHPGRGAAVKHMAANNQEAARTSHCSVVSERCMRELYLKAFELVIKYSDPFAVMTSLNCVNGPHGTNSKALATDILRGEWHYDGLVVTDWNTTTPARGASTTGCINAGDALIMPGSEDDHRRLRAALHNMSEEGERVTLGQLQRCAMDVLRYILRTGRV